LNRQKLIAFSLAGLFLGGIAFTTVYFSAHYFAHNSQAAPLGEIDTATLIRKMNLSAEQKKELIPMEASLKKDIDGIQVKLAQERMALCELLSKDTSDPQELDAYVNRVSAMEAQQQRRVVEHLLAMRGLLTPAQKKELFSSLMQAICKGCRSTGSHHKCICGMCAHEKEA